jgi:hypothetical protein
MAAADDTVTFSEWLDLLSEAVGTRTFDATEPMPTDAEMVSYSERLAEVMKPDATKAQKIVLVARICDYIERSRQTVWDGNLAVLQHIHGSQTGGGKNASLKIPASDKHLLSEGLLAEFDQLPSLQKKVGNELAQGKLTAEALIIMGEFQGGPREIALKK